MISRTRSSDILQAGISHFRVLRVLRGLVHKPRFVNVPSSSDQGGV